MNTDVICISTQAISPFRKIHAPVFAAVAKGFRSRSHTGKTGGMTEKFFTKLREHGAFHAGGRRC